MTNVEEDIKVIGRFRYYMKGIQYNLFCTRKTKIQLWQEQRKWMMSHNLDFKTFKEEEDYQQYIDRNILKDINQRSEKLRHKLLIQIKPQSFLARRKNNNVKAIQNV